MRMAISEQSISHQRTHAEAEAGAAWWLLCQLAPSMNHHAQSTFLDSHVESSVMASRNGALPERD